MAAATTESVAESSVIESLGPLFKITEVFLWDDPVISVPKAASDHLYNLIDERATSCTTADINSNINTIDGNTSWEDFELAKQMDALGLPISFSTTKQRNSMAIKGKRKEIRAKPLSVNKDTENSITRASKSCLLEDNSSSNVLHDSTNICCKNTEDGTGATYHDVYDGQGRGVSPLDRIKDSCLPATIPGNFVEKHSRNDETDVIMSNCVEDQLSSHDPDMEMGAVLENIISSDPENFPRNDLEDVKLGTHQEEELFHKHVLDSHVGDSSISCYIAGENNDDDDKKNVKSRPTSMESSLSCASADHHVPDYSDNSVCYEFGDWRVIWDPFYKRNYFYNFQSQESTWYPPPGLEHFALCPNVSNSNESSNITAEEHTSIEVACDAMQDIDLHDSHNVSSLFHKKEDGVEYLNLSTAEIISSKLDDDITANFVSSHSNEFTIVKKTVYDEVLLHTPTDRSTGEHDVNGYWEKQENGITSSEACTAADVLLELLVSNSLASTVNEEVNGEDGSNSSNTGVISSVDELDNYHGIFSKKKKQRVRRLQSKLAFQGVDGRLPDSLIKYWYQRYLLFSQFDNGIKMDEEGWFSVTPESIARHHASRCGSGIIIDCFTGVGGNAIQFAMKRNYVIAIDIDPQKIDCAQHNAAIYGVSDQINFIVGDFFQIAPHLKGDVIFLSPPWGGPDYNKVQAYDITTMLKPHDGKYLFEIARTIASKVVMFLPRNADLDQLAELSLSVNPPWAVEVEKNFLNGRLKAITAYFDNPVL